MKSVGKHAKDNAPEQSDLNYMIDKSEGTNKLLLILSGKGGMREGEIVHLRSSWIHIGDEQAILKKVDHIAIPSSGGICECDKCMLQEYFKVKRKSFRKKHKKDGIKTDHDWYRRMEKKFYEHIRQYRQDNTKENKKRVKKGLKPNEFSVREHFIKNGINLPHHTWTPKSESGARVIPLIFSEYTNFIKKYFEENESVNITRQAVWMRIYRMGKKLIRKRIYPHALRSAAISYLADRGASMFTLMNFSGHKEIASIQPYHNPKEEIMIAETQQIRNNDIKK